MYQVENPAVVVKLHRALVARRRGAPLVARTVVLLGFTSLLTDISSEMVSAILPLYLVVAQGFTPLQFGIVDGLYQGAGALVRIASGFTADRLRRHKEVAAVGYGLSTACKLGLALVGSAFGAVSALVLVDRTGKGIRTAPRDALIALSTPKERLGTAFGVHRAMDTTGAMLGPLVAFGLLALAPDAFRTVFAVSFLVGLVGLAVLVLLVEDRPKRLRDAAAPSLRAALALVHGRSMRPLLVAGAALALATASDGFLYLVLQRRLDLDPALFPLLFVATSAVFMVLALPAGRLADRVGRAPVLLGGYGVLLAAYLALLIPALGGLALPVVLVLLGGYYAATDGVFMALAAGRLPDPLQASGMSVLGTATGLGRLFASVLFGALWTAAGASAALTVFAGGLTLAIILAAAVLRPGSARA